MSNPPPPRPLPPHAELPYCWRQLSHRAGSPGILISGLRSPGNPESILQATSNLRQVPPGILEMLLGGHGFGMWRKPKTSFSAVWRIPGSPWESPWHRWAPSLSLRLLSQLPSGARALSTEPPRNTPAPGWTCHSRLEKDARRKDAGGRRLTEPGRRGGRLELPLAPPVPRTPGEVVGGGGEPG